MADNTVLPGTGETYASDDISGVKHQRVKISLGAAGAASDLEINNGMPVLDNFTELALGNINGYTIMNAMGERETMGIVTQGEDVTRMNQLSGTPQAPDSHTLVPTPPAGGEQMTVISEDAADNSSGTGVQTLRIEYLDNNGNQQSEDITMNGTTAVNTVATNIRFVNDMYSLTVGSNGVAEGNIRIMAQSDNGLVYNMIHIGGNKSLVPHRMVPTGKTLILKSWHASEGQQKRVAFRLRSTDMNGVLRPGVFCFKDSAYLRGGASGNLTLNIPVPALSIVKVSAWASESDGYASCAWWGILVDD